MRDITVIFETEQQARAFSAEKMKKVIAQSRHQERKKRLHAKPPRKD